MLSARDRRDRPPEEGVVAELQGFAVDKAFFTSHKGILLETELALTLIIFICFTASISAYMAAALLEFFITLAFLFLYATQYYQHFDRLNWPCLLQGRGQSGGPHPLDLLSHSAKVQTQPWPGLTPLWWTPAAVTWASALALGFWSWLLWFICFHSLGSSDFLRCVSAIIIFLVVSFAAVTSRDGAAIAAFVFGIILVSVFAYDALKIYRTEMAPGAIQGDQH
uniref:CKLF like MARVEL transmembrane domain containing 5 n=1 Tax=Rhinopithecus bieti TaxID=61621 RepID=A0A2K6MLF2_RHIBE